MAEEPNYPDLIKKLEGQFGGRVGFMGYQILTLSQSGQPCDITRYNQQPLLDVVIDPKIAIAMMYGVGPAKLMQLIDPVPLADGRSVSRRALLLSTFTVRAFVRQTPPYYALC